MNGDAHLLPRYRRVDPSAVPRLGREQAEIERLRKALSKQSKAKRRLQRAYEKLRDEKRELHEVLAIAEQLQDEVEELAAKVATYEAGSLAQAAADNRRSKQALSVRYGRIHGALRALLADSAAAADAEQALRDVESRAWVQARLPRIRR
jgi:DNA repair exonuclease SbcCD ATPase subunit